MDFLLLRMIVLISSIVINNFLIEIIPIEKLFINEYKINFNKNIFFSSIIERLNNKLKLE